MQILESLKTNQPLILLSSLTVIIATFLSTNDDQRDAFEYSIYAAFSFFGSFVAAMAYSIIRSDAVHNLVKKIFGYDDNLYGMLFLWEITFKIATYACFVIGMVFIIIMTYELSSSFPKFGILTNLIKNICYMSLPLIFFYAMKYVQELYLRGVVIIYKIAVIASLCSGAISICFTIFEIVTGVDYKDIIHPEISTLLLYTYFMPATMFFILYIIEQKYKIKK